MIAAGVIGKYHTSGTTEGAVGVTIDGGQVGITRTYAKGHATGSGQGEVGVPKDSRPLIGKGHGHELNKPMSGGDREFSNVNKIPNSIQNQSGIHIYIPYENAPANSGMHGVYQDY